jgi:hypothetical protein
VSRDNVPIHDETVSATDINRKLGTDFDTITRDMEVSIDVEIRRLVDTAAAARGRGRRDATEHVIAMLRGLGR